MSIYLQVLLPGIITVLYTHHCCGHLIFVDLGDHFPRIYIPTSKHKIYLGNAMCKEIMEVLHSSVCSQIHNILVVEEQGPPSIKNGEKLKVYVILAEAQIPLNIAFMIFMSFIVTNKTIFLVGSKDEGNL